jgi:CRP/FNR family transcriptional regulator, cyclic AMP receptor protein
MLRRSPRRNISRVMRLLDLEPDLLRFVSREDRTPLEPVRLAVIPMPEGHPLALTEFLESRGAIAAVVQTGMVLHDLQLGAQPGVRVLGPGEVLSLREASASPLLAASTYRATSDTTLVLLRDDFMLAARRAPGLMIGVQARLAEQIERLATQLVICQMPRVEDRLLAMLWLLAESWGRVTPSGTTLPLSLTHELLGAMIGARRPTVTLALGELSERGALVHQDRGWLLLERPEPTTDPPTMLDAPRQLSYAGASWGEPAPAENGAELRLESLRETIRGLRDQHVRNIRRSDDRLRQSALSQQRARELRESIRSRRRLSRRLPPSS